jgi:hypothetical protein
MAPPSTGKFFGKTNRMARTATIRKTAGEQPREMTEIFFPLEKAERFAYLGTVSHHRDCSTYEIKRTLLLPTSRPPRMKQEAAPSSAAQITQFHASDLNSGGMTTEIQVRNGNMQMVIIRVVLERQHLSDLSLPPTRYIRGRGPANRAEKMQMY